MYIFADNNYNVEILSVALLACHLRTTHNPEITHPQEVVVCTIVLWKSAA